MVRLPQYPPDFPRPAPKPPRANAWGALWLHARRADRNFVRCGEGLRRVAPA